MAQPKASSMTRRRFLQGAAAAAGTVGAAPLRRAWAQAGPLRVGVILPTSGHLAFPGQASRIGMDLAAKMINEAGGVNGRMLQLLHADTESKAETGRTTAEKLIREGAHILVGAWDSGATIAAAQAAEQAKFPLLVNVASAPEITERGYKYVFRNFTPAPTLVANGVERIKDLLQVASVKPKTAVFMHVNDTFGQGVARGVKALWPKYQVPVEIVETISYDPRARDLSVEVAKAKALKPDLLLPATRVNDAILLVREMVKQEFNPMGIIGPGNPGPYEKAFTDALGKYGDFYMNCVPWHDPTSERTKLALARFAKEHPDRRFELNSGFSFEAVDIVADVFRRAKATDPNALREALAATRIEKHIMFGGPITFDEKGQNPNIGGVMLQNFNREPKVVSPADKAEAKVVFPVPKWSERTG